MDLPACSAYWIPRVRFSFWIRPWAEHCWRQRHWHFQQQRCMCQSQNLGTGQTVLFGNFGWFFLGEREEGVFAGLFLMHKWHCREQGGVSREKKLQKPHLSSHFKHTLNVQVMSVSIGIKQDNCANTLSPASQEKYQLKNATGVNIVHKYFISLFYFTCGPWLEGARAVEEGGSEKGNVPAIFERNIKNFSIRQF